MSLPRESRHLASKRHSRRGYRFSAQHDERPHTCTGRGGHHPTGLYYELSSWPWGFKWRVAFDSPIEQVVALTPIGVSTPTGFVPRLCPLGPIGHLALGQPRGRAASPRGRLPCRLNLCADTPNRDTAFLKVNPLVRLHDDTQVLAFQQRVQLIHPVP